MLNRSLPLLFHSNETSGLRPGSAILIATTPFLEVETRPTNDNAERYVIEMKTELQIDNKSCGCALSPFLTIPCWLQLWLKLSICQWFLILSLV